MKVILSYLTRNTILTGSFILLILITIISFAEPNYVSASISPGTCDKAKIQELAGANRHEV